MSNPHPGTTGAPAFAERDFERLAAAINAVPATQRELFLTKLVIVLAAASPGVDLASAIGRAQRDL